MPIHLAVGDSVTGLLVDGIAETPYVAATLKINATGAVLEVPYISHGDTDQFHHVEQWFSSRTPPANLLLHTGQGAISLFDIAWGGRSERDLALGVLRPTVVVLHGRDGELADPLAVSTLQSRVDGLNEWVRSSAITIDHHVDSERLVTGLSISVSSEPAATWRQGDATMTLRPRWGTEEISDHAGRATRILDNLVLESTFDGSRGVAEHLREQRKVVDLLTILFGTRARYLDHRVRDPRFLDYSLGGTVIGQPWVEVLSRQTFLDRSTRSGRDEPMGQPIATLAEVGTSALVTWANNYDSWKRFVLPAAAAFRRESPYLEDSITSMCIAMEAGGQILGPMSEEVSTYNGRRHPTLATYVYRCLRAVDVDWGENVSSVVGLARAIARVGNTLKHPTGGIIPTTPRTT